MKHKRKLTEQELNKISEWMEGSPQGEKPSIRQIASAFGVSRPSVVRSLGKRHQQCKSIFGEAIIKNDGPKIEAFTTKENGE